MTGRLFHPREEVTPPPVGEVTPPPVGEEEDISLVVSQTHAARATAAEALQRNHGDIVMTIMELIDSSTAEHLTSLRNHELRIVDADNIYSYY
jgi:hypothetical protein